MRDRSTVCVTQVSPSLFSISKQYVQYGQNSQYDTNTNSANGGSTYESGNGHLLNEDNKNDLFVGTIKIHPVNYIENKSNVKNKTNSNFKNNIENNIISDIKSVLIIITFARTSECTSVLTKLNETFTSHGLLSLYERDGLNCLRCQLDLDLDLDLDTERVSDTDTDTHTDSNTDLEPNCSGGSSSTASSSASASGSGSGSRSGCNLSFSLKVLSDAIISVYPKPCCLFI